MGCCAQMVSYRHHINIFFGIVVILAIFYYISLNTIGDVIGQYVYQKSPIENPQQTNFVRHQGPLKYVHFYYSKNWVPGKNECIPYENPPISSFDDIGEGYWNFPERPDEGIQPHLYGTLYAQKIIYDSQHPSNCSKVKFLFITEQFSGIGSQFHVYGAALAVAINLHRLMVWGPLEKWVSNDFCGNITSWDCFVFPPSGCYPTEEQIKNSTIWTENGIDDGNTVMKLILGGWNNEIRRFIPENFKHLLQCSPIPNHHQLWWWRAQSVAYLLRPLPKTLKEFENLKQNIFSNRKIMRGSIGTYVRHADKGSEMELKPFSEYKSTIESLISHYPYLKKEVYIGTDDPAVINSSIELNKEGDWKFVWLDELRKNEGYEVISKAGSKMTLHSLLGLNLFLETDAHVGHFQSNWCRLIMEMLSTVGHCAWCPYRDVRITCYNESLTVCEDILIQRLDDVW